MLNPAPAKLAEILSQVKTIAIVGAKDVPSQPVDRVGRYLMDAGFTVIPVHPKRTNVWGLETYPSLWDVPVAIDCVDLFRAGRFCAAHAIEVMALSTMPKLFWMQSGIESSEARRLMEDKGVTVVENECLMVFHRQHCV